MAINKIYFAEFTDIRDNEWRVDIYKNPQGTITAKQFVCADPGFSLSWQGAEDIFTPLLPSTCTIPFIVESADDASFIVDLFTMDEGEYLIDIIRDPDGSADLHWRGFLTSDNLQIPDTVRPYVVELQAVDGLQTLSRRTHPSTGNHSLADIMVDALATIPTADRFSDTEAFLRYGKDYEPQGLPTYNGDPLREIKIAVTSIDPANAFAPTEAPTAEEILQQVLTLYNLRLMQVDGVWSVEPITRVLNGSSTIPFDSVSKNKAVATGGTFILPKYLETGAKKLVGDWSIQFLPPLRRISRELNYLGNRPLAGVAFPGFDIGVRINNQTSPPAVVQQTADIDTQFPINQKFSFRARITMEQDPSSTTTSSPLVRYRVQFTVKVGSYYLKRNHDLGTDTTTVQSEFFNVGNSDQTILRPQSPGGLSWTTNSADRVQIIGDILNSDLENGFISGGTDRCEMEISLETPPLPAATDVDVLIESRAYGFSQTGGSVAAAIADAANIYADPQLFVGSGSDSDVVTFAASVDNGASEEMTIEPSSMYGESGNANDQFPSVYFGSLVGPGGSLPTGFQSSLTTTTTLVNELICVDRLRHLQDAQELRNGSAYTSDVLTPMNFLSFDSKTWIILNLTHTAKAAQYQIECVKIAESSGPTSDAFTKRAQTILPPRTLASGQESLRRELYVNAQSLQADIETETSARQALTLSSLTDVNPGTPSNGSILVYNDTDDEWRSAVNAGGTASEAIFVIDSTGGTDNVTATPSTLTLDSTQFISTATAFTVANNTVRVNMAMRAVIGFYVGFDDPNGADRTKGEAFLEKSTDSGTNWTLVTGSNAFAYLRNGNNNDTDTATSGNLILSVSDGDMFRVRVKTQGSSLTTSTVANMSGLSIFDLLGGARGADGVAGADGADGADGSDALALGGNDQTLTADRTIDLDGNVLTVDDGSTDLFKISTHNGVQVFGDFTVDSGAVAGASIKLEEADLLGQNFIEIKAPISVTADTTLTLPDGAGTSGQVLSTNGSGTLSWVTRIAETNPVVKGALTISRVTAGNVPRLYIKGEDDTAGVFLKAKEAIATDVTFELPDADGSDGDILTTDGAGVMAFEKPKSYHIIASSFYAADGNGDYIPIGGTLSETTSSNYYTIWTAPCAGRVVKATAIVSATTAGASTLTVRKYPTPATFASASHTFTATLTTGTFDFGASATFAAGDRLQFRFDPTGRPNGVQISILLELTHE